ncbi:type II toxin-antitoxin system antitoxin DNA ADP-ribosyl glycohydrolase DarG [Hyalangium versicolor]|uniref:type II toxin-antitoxin system antitoxin DNA ADP-ribosyl glycohydrolase DarG n=1 Tax=Hyalangium versicolor TaxID=2861190 RepID=UPI001CCE27E8|nr:macro domain-containing protein [Hyalangium versicolor]
MIEGASGNLLDADVDALVNTVNTVGVMGKGIALQFRMAFPENYEAYKQACARSEVQPGHMFVVPTGALTGPRFIINFPTKRHWRAGSRLGDIEAGLEDLVRVIREKNIRSIAVPPLGCGNGGLRWEDVEPRILAALSPLEDVRVLLFAPQGAPPVSAMKVRTQRPRMTPGRAGMLQLLEHYTHAATEGSTQLVVQKIVYFLQEAGEQMRLQFIKAQFGPYAEALNPALQRMEGHFFRGYGDRSQPADIYPLPEAVKEASALLSQHPQTRQHVERTRELLKGFESPHGLELLATVHWVARGNSGPARELEAVTREVHAWSERKQRAFSPFQIEVAWKHLQELGWL